MSRGTRISTPRERPRPTSIETRDPTTDDSNREARIELPLTHAVRLDDVEVSYTEIAGGGTPLVLLHGLTGHRDDFLPVMPRLRDRHPGLWLIAPDLRGHGDSTHPNDRGSYTFERLVGDLQTFLDQRGIARCHLLGHSFGGMVSLRFALRFPARLASLVLLATAPFAPDGFSADLFEKSGDIAKARGMAFLQARIEENARSTATSRPSDRATLRWADAYWAHHRHRFRSMDPVAYRELGLAMVRQESLEQRLAELALPVSVIVGELDEGFRAGADRLTASIPAAVRFDIAEAGHHPHREDPDAWLDAVSAHLERVPVEL